MTFEFDPLGVHMDVPVELPKQVFEIVMDGKDILHETFTNFYTSLATENDDLRNTDTKTKSIRRYSCGSSHSFHNVVLGCPHKKTWEQTIESQATYFRGEKVSFVWLLEEGQHEPFEKVLLEKNFKKVGTYQGVMGPADRHIVQVKVSDEYKLEQVLHEEQMIGFNTLVCSTFSGSMGSNNRFTQALWSSSRGDNPDLFHWIAKRNGKTISAVSTSIKGDVVSFWNSATDPDFRRKGINTALRHVALSHAIARGCKFGASFHLTDCPAQVICSKLGYQPKWRFNVFESTHVEA